MATTPPPDSVPGEANHVPCVLGWHDSHCASAAVLSRDGRILYAAAEERFTKHKLQKGCPNNTFADVRDRFGGSDMAVCYADMPLAAKAARNLGLIWNSWKKGLNTPKSVGSLVRTALGRIARGQASCVVGSDVGQVENVRTSSDTNQSPTLGKGGAPDRLCEHHTAHAASAYYLSGFDQAYVVTIDGVGDCLSGAVFEGSGGRLTRRAKFYYNDLTVAADYEVFTAMLGFNPDRHCGKITGLAAFGTHNRECIAALNRFFRSSWQQGRSNFFDRMHEHDGPKVLQTLRRLRRTEFGHFSRADLAYAIQYLAEQRVLQLIRENVPVVAGGNIALAGGVFANVRINQKIKELGFQNIFIQPAMDDGGLSLGAALYHLSGTTDLHPHRLPHMFVGPGYGDDHIQDALERAGLAYDRVDNLPHAVARLVADGKVVARFDGRMEFGPRALGNRSILYHTCDPAVNQWLNKRLGRSEFMPFAPATLGDHADGCYEGLDGCRHTAEFMTITFNCTDYMKRVSPAVVHVDGTARAQLVTPQANPGLYEIVDEYRKLTGIPSVVNTSFNMHESPIVASPQDAIQSFQQGRLDYLAIGPFLAGLDQQRRKSDAASARQPAELAPA